MARATVPGTAVERLAHSLFDRSPHSPLTDELTTWLASSARFRSFAETHHDKIRKKLRAASDTEALLDLRTELRVAHLLLADRRIELAFEAYGSGKAGPDFTVTFRGERSFNLEVTRHRRTPTSPPTGAGAHGGQLMAKLRQLPPSAPNALLVAIDGDNANTFDVAAATRALRNRADAKDEAFFVSRGFEGTRGFYDRYLRLDAVVVWCEGGSNESRVALWNNRSARIRVPDRAMRASILCLRAAEELDPIEYERR
jgi:hypothetical protein